MTVGWSFGWCNVSADGPNAGKGGGFNPPSPKMTVEQFTGLATFFKNYLADNPFIKWSIIAAGVAGVFETAHTLWLFLVWVSGRLPR
jgi:hypothetical protein